MRTTSFELGFFAGMISLGIASTCGHRFVVGMLVITIVVCIGRGLARS